MSFGVPSLDLYPRVERKNPLRQHTMAGAPARTGVPQMHVGQAARLGGQEYGCTAGKPPLDRSPLRTHSPGDWSAGSSFPAVASTCTPSRCGQSAPFGAMHPCTNCLAIRIFYSDQRRPACRPLMPASPVSPPPASRTFVMRQMSRRLRASTKVDVGIRADVELSRGASSTIELG